MFTISTVTVVSLVHLKVRFHIQFIRGLQRKRGTKVTSQDLSFRDRQLCLGPRKAALAQQQLPLGDLCEQPGNWILQYTVNFVSSVAVGHLSTTIPEYVVSALQSSGDATEWQW